MGTINLFERKKEESRQKATAKAEYNLDGSENCPVCNSPMTKMTAAGIPTQVCLTDRVSLPVKD